MNEIIYNRFLINNPQLVTDYNKRCKKQVIRNCDEYNAVNRTLYHGTTEENAQSILNNRFLVDRYSGTQTQGIGVYTALDDETAKTFGKKVLKLDTNLAKLLDMSTKAHKEFNGLKSEFIKKIKQALGTQQSEYFSPDEWNEKIEGKIDSTSEILARIRGVSVRDTAENSVLMEESSIILANMFDEELARQKGQSAILSQTRGVFMEPIEQLVVRDLTEIKSVSEWNI